MNPDAFQFRPGDPVQIKKPKPSSGLQYGYVVEVWPNGSVFVAPTIADPGVSYNPQELRKLEVDSYIAMVVNCRSQRVVTNILCDGKRWMSVAECENLGFRSALKLPNLLAWKMQEEMIASGWFGCAGESGSTIELQVRRLNDRPIYVFYDWDAEDGCDGMIAVIRCDGMYPAIRWFKTKYPDRYHTDLQVRHIGDVAQDWPVIAQRNLDADLIEYPVNLPT